MEVETNIAEKYPIHFEQNNSDVTLEIPIGDTPSKRIKVDFAPLRIKIVIDNDVVFDDALLGTVNAYDSVWCITDRAGKRLLMITLIKVKQSRWHCLGKTEADKLQKTELNLLTTGDFNPDSTEEAVEKNEHDEIILEEQFLRLKGEKGLDDDETLKAFFSFFDNCIQLYRLKKLETHLVEVVPVVRKRNDQYYLKGIQALGFVYWKQSKFREALELFLEMEDKLGKNAPLCENIGHTYSSLGDLEKAEQYFRDALKFLDAEHGSNQGGTLLGLALVRDRLNKPDDALPIAIQAYEFYKKQAEGQPASLQAKAGVSVAKILIKLGRSPEAEFYFKEAVYMFDITCGKTSPLVASARMEYGSLLWDLDRRDEAQRQLLTAYEVETIKDAFDMLKVLEIHNLIMDTHLKKTKQIVRNEFKMYCPVAIRTTERVRSQTKQDGNAAVYYKAVGELHMWAGDYTTAETLILEALGLLKVEKSVDCSNLIKQCEDMAADCRKTLENKKSVPMVLDVPEPFS